VPVANVTWGCFIKNGTSFSLIGEELRLPKGLRPLKSPAHGQVTMLRAVENLRDEFSDLGAKRLMMELAGGRTIISAPIPRARRAVSSSVP
jgi:hypothetical protein